MLATLTGLCQQTMRAAIAADDDLVAKGLNANKALALIKLFWMRTGIELDVNVFYLHRTPRAIVAAIGQGCVQPTDKILLLREGDRARPLFLFAGGVNCFLETQDLVDALTFAGAIYGITLTDFGRPGDSPPEVADEVERAYRAMKTIQPEGPYRLAGYSFGGVLALELARRARVDGDMIEALMLLDPPQNDHSWPLLLWAGLMRRTITRQVTSVLGKLAGRALRRGKPSAERQGDVGVEALRPGLIPSPVDQCGVLASSNRSPSPPSCVGLSRASAVVPANSMVLQIAGSAADTRHKAEHDGRGDGVAPHQNDVISRPSAGNRFTASASHHSPSRRGHQLFFRFRHPRQPDYPLYAPQWAGGYTPVYDACARQLLQMKGLYRPSVYDGPLVFFASTSGSPIDCNAKRIWKTYLPEARWVSVSGNHLSMIVARNARKLAAVMDMHLRPAPISASATSAPGKSATA
ncbi:thioesterase superfamily protein [Rhizobium sp. PP-CC-3A-592]|nr:thioesterase superfamily protein [Rhizobium sp. PP-CC-3A-592]